MGRLALLFKRTGSVAEGAPGNRFKESKMMVSVIIPVYNRAELASQAIASVGPSAGSGMAYEIVVVDDGSIPIEAARLKGYCGRIKNCRLIRLDHNRGAQIARNAGLDRAIGLYIKFLDSDDILLPGSLAQEIAEMEKKSVDLVVSAWLRTAVADIQLDNAVLYSPKDYAGNPYDAILAGYGAPISAVLYQKSAIGGIRWDPIIRHPDDWFFLVKVLLSCPKVLTRMEPAFVWRDHAGARASDSSLIEYAYARFQILDYFYQVMTQRGEVTPQRRVSLCNYLYRDIYVAHRFDPNHYQKILDRIDELMIDYRPNGEVENHIIKRMVCRLLGYRTYVPLHNRLRSLLGYR
jgi:glycosyltransferase involved in cell wall biosynthesis